MTISNSAWRNNPHLGDFSSTLNPAALRFDHIVQQSMEQVMQAAQ
jgi:hypothetical protein